MYQPTVLLPRRIHYRPAFTTLFFIVGLCALFLNDLTKPVYMPKIYRMYFPSDEKSPWGLSFNTESILHSLKKKKLIRVWLEEPAEWPPYIGQDKRKMTFIRQEALRLQFTCDTTQVLAVHLGDDCTYGQFLQLQKMMEEDLHKRYVFMHDWFYIFGDEPPSPGPEVLSLEL